MVDVAKAFTGPIDNALSENTAMAEQPIRQQNMQQANQLNQLSIQQKQRQVQQEQQFQSTMRQMPQNLSPMEQLSYISVAAAKTGDFNAVDKVLDAQGRYMANMSRAQEYQAKTQNDKLEQQAKGLDLIAQLAPTVHSQQQLDQTLDQYGLSQFKGLQYSPEMMQQIAQLALKEKDRIHLQIESSKAQASISNLNNESLNRNARTASEIALNDVRKQKLQEEIKNIGTKGGPKGKEVAMGAPSNAEMSDVSATISSVAPGQVSKAPMLAGQIKEYQRKNPALSWEEAKDRVMGMAIDQGMFGPPENVRRIYNKNLLQIPSENTPNKQISGAAGEKDNPIHVTAQTPLSDIKKGKYYSFDGTLYNSPEDGKLVKVK